MSSEIKALRSIVADDALGMNARRDAAEHIVRLTVKEIPEPEDDCEEVQKLMQPWPRTTPSLAQIADMWADHTRGRSVHGYSAREARIAVQIRHRRNAVKELAEDESEHKLIRDAARETWIPPFDVSSPNLA